MMKDNYLMPFIAAIEEEPTLSPTKKDILCLVLTTMQIDSEGLALAELSTLMKFSRMRLYRILRELEEAGFISRTKKGIFMHITAKIEAIKRLAEKQAFKKELLNNTLKLRRVSAPK